jgi:hypothetical protein
MRNSIMYSVAAVFVAFAQFAAVSAIFTLPVPAIADQASGPMAVSVAQERSLREVAEVIVEGRQAI